MPERSRASPPAAALVARPCPCSSTHPSHAHTHMHTRRFYKYVAGQRFGKHVDGSVDLPGGRRTEYTLLVYLSSCVGGETRFYGRGRRLLCVCAPAAGAALLHRHGDHCLEHEGAAVSAGVKYVLRSDVVYARV